MTEKQCDRLIEYFNGTLSPQEEAEFEAHLKHCPECQEELREWQLLTEDLPLLSEPVEPPEGMKKRILDHVLHADGGNNPIDDAGLGESRDDSIGVNATHGKVQPIARRKTQDNGGERPQFATNAKPAKKKNGWLPWTLAVCLLLSLLGNGYLLSFVNKSANQHISTPKIVDHVALQSGDGTSAKANGVALVLATGEQKYMVIEADELKPLSGKEVYTAWAIKGEKPVAIGTFKPNASGKGTLNYQFQGNEDDWDAVAVSCEPDATSTAPKGPIVMQSEL